jgi:hypothetical protein
MELETVGDWSSAEVSKGGSEEGRLLFNFSSPYGYHAGMGSRWVVDSRGSKLLWLPPNWRTPRDIRWDGNFLALLRSYHLEPIIIEFKS